MTKRRDLLLAVAAASAAAAIGFAGGELGSRVVVSAPARPAIILGNGIGGPQGMAWVWPCDDAPWRMYSARSSIGWAGQNEKHPWKSSHSPQP